MHPCADNSSLHPVSASTTLLGTWGCSAVLGSLWFTEHSCSPVGQVSRAGQLREQVQTCTQTAIPCRDTPWHQGTPNPQGH